MKRISRSIVQTEAIAGRLAKKLKPAQCVALYGDLGAGKTQFVRGLVKGLGGKGRSVSSPTFVLLNVYETPGLKVFHLDAYRIHGPEDFQAIGFTELLDQRGLVVIEWPERVESLLPKKRINVYLKATSPRVREIQIEDSPQRR